MLPKRDDEQTTKQGKIKLLSQWTMDGLDEQYVSCWAKYCKLMHKIKNTCQVFGPKRVTFGNQGHDTLSLSSGQTTTYCKTKGIQSYLRIWGGRSGPSELKKREGGFIGVAYKNAKILYANAKAQNPFRISGNSPNSFVNIMTGHPIGNIFVVTLLHGGPLGRHLFRFGTFGSIVRLFVSKLCLF